MTPQGKCLHVVQVDNYQPELCEITLPLMRRYAARIGADFNLITQRRFPRFPGGYERMQIQQAGAAYAFNLSVDADLLFGENVGDFSTRYAPTQIGAVLMFHAEHLFPMDGNPYFIRDGRFLGISEVCIGTSWITHDLWTPLPGGFDLYRYLPLDGDVSHVTEYALCYNLAKYHLNTTSVFSSKEQLFHVSVRSLKDQSPVEVALGKLKEWGLKP
jgi:hypothetical protein